MASIPTPKYILEIGQVTKVKQHKSDNDGVNYSCDVLLGDSDNSLPNVPVASSRAGFVCIPEVEDQVLVGFIRGNLSMPVILGTLYNDKVKPPLYSPGEAVYVCPEYKKKESDYPKLEELKRIYMELPMHKMKFVVREEDIHYELDKDKYKFDLKVKEGIKLEVNKNNTSLAISKDGDITITEHAAHGLRRMNFNYLPPAETSFAKTELAPGITMIQMRTPIDINTIKIPCAISAFCFPVPHHERRLGQCRKHRVLL